MKPILDVFTRPRNLASGSRSVPSYATIPLYGGASSVLGAMGSNGTLFNVVSTLAGGTSRVTWRLYRKAKSGNPDDRKLVTSHLALDVWNRPNEYFTQQLFVETQQQHVELVGESIWVIDKNMFGWPEAMWVVRPDRIRIVPGSEKEIAGYVYLGPNGEQIPLEADQVLRPRMPNPADPGPAGRGLGATQTILSQLQAVNLSAEWNRAFFANSAVPGGIIQVPTTLDDRSFRRLQMQWAETHQGVSNAARVGILEGDAKWVGNTTSHKDMQFVDLLNTSREVIREAFGYPQFMAGIVTDVNRANAEASIELFNNQLLVPRLDRIKDVLNTWFLPMFGPRGFGTGSPDVEFDYDNPTPPNREQEMNEMAAKVNQFAQLVDAGVDAFDAAQVVGLPLMNMAPQEVNNARSEQPV